MENFEKQNFAPEEKKGSEEKLKTEALPKIERALTKFPVYGLITDFLFPEILPEKKAALDKKWQGVEIESLDIKDPRLKEYTEDKSRLDEELGKFIKQKSPQEILSRASDVFNTHLRKGAVANSIDDLMRAHHQAYEVARLFLTKGLTREAAQSCLDMLWYRIKEIDINDPRQTQLMKQVIGIKRWFPEISINLSRSPEKSGEILSHLLVEGSLSDRNKGELFKMLVATRKIQVMGENGKTKIKKVIVGHDLLSKAAKKELLSLWGETAKKEKVLMAVNFLEQRGILNLDKDADFFDEITERKQ